jgi:hypothetical protein
MKKLISTVLVVCLLLCLVGCSKNPATATEKGNVEGLNSKLENSLELRKSIFAGNIKSVSTKDMLIPKYNFSLTEYTVYTVEVENSLDGVTPTGEITVVSAGSSDEFFARLSLKKNETYILTAEPWVYGDEIVYLLSIFTSNYPRIDKAGRVVMENEDGKLADYGTKDSYIENILTTKTNFATSHEGFYEPRKILEDYRDIFKAVLDTNSKNWLRDEFEYEFVPSDEFIKTTVDTTQAVLDKIDAILQKETITEDDVKSILIR